MKKIISVLTIIFWCMLVIGQDNYTDVLYLKDGSVIRGKIIEQTPDEGVKIKIADGSVFTYKSDEIEKMTKENESKSQNSGFFFGASYAAILTNSPSDGELNANYDFGSTSMKLGYVFKNGLGFVVAGDVHFNSDFNGDVDRVTYIAKGGPVFGLGLIHLYPMFGYVGGEPVYDIGSGSGYYAGGGFDIRFAANAGLYLEYGICNWGTEFEKDGVYGPEIYELGSSLISHTFAIGISVIL